MIYKTLITAVFLSFLAACNQMVHEVGNGNMTTEKIDVDNFEEVIISGNFDIYLAKGSTPGLSIVADENLHQYITTSVQGDRLEIETSEKIRSDEGIKLYITYETLTALDIGGAAEVVSEDVISGDYLNLTMSGAGSVDLEVSLRVLKINVSGAGSVEVKGTVDEQNVQMSGAGDYDARDLLSQHCKISISGVGSADINVEQSLDASVSGVGGITYRGNPADIQTEVSGLGSIEKSED